MPTPADFLPRLCRAALRPSKEFLKTCFFLVRLHFSFASVKKMPPPPLATTMNSCCRRWTAICTARRTLPRHLLLSLQRRSLALCSSITRLQMKTLRTWVVCGPSPCISIPHIPLNRCCFILFYLLNKLVQLAICKGGSYCTATLGEPGTSQVHRSSLKIHVQVWFYWIILATLVVIISWFRSQHSRLADLPHLAAKVVKKAHDATCAQAHQQDSARP